MKRVLVLGGTGFIGSSVLASLRALDDVRVMALAHRRVDYRALEWVDLVVGSLSTFDLSWIDTFRPDTIIHAARLSGRGASGRRHAARRGRVANERLIRHLRAHAPEVHVLYVSGTLAYGDGVEAEVDERSPLSPISFAREYGRAEAPWVTAQRSGTLPVTIVRPPWVVGSGSWFHHYYALPALYGGSVPLYGSGGNWMTLLDVSDCGGVIVHLAARTNGGRCVNLFAPGQTTTQRVFTEELSRTLGLGIRRIEGSGLKRLRDRAVREALTSSFKAATIHADLLASYDFQVPEWRDMIERHLPRS